MVGQEFTHRFGQESDSERRIMRQLNLSRLTLYRYLSHNSHSPMSHNSLGSAGGGLVHEVSGILFSIITNVGIHNRHTHPEELGEVVEVISY
ncbi:hypothetical protein ES703_99081 [subsurface metagenome]